MSFVSSEQQEVLFLSFESIVSIDHKQVIVVFGFV